MTWLACALENFLLFTEIPTEKLIQMQGWSKKSESREVGWLIEPRSLLGGACTQMTNVLASRSQAPPVKRYNTV